MYKSAELRRNIPVHCAWRPAAPTLQIIGSDKCVCVCVCVCVHACVRVCGVGVENRAHVKLMTNIVQFQPICFLCALDEVTDESRGPSPWRWAISHQVHQVGFSLWASWWTRAIRADACYSTWTSNVRLTPLMYTTGYKFGVAQTILYFPWKLTILFIKWFAKWIENIVKTLIRLEIRIFIWNIHFVLQTCRSKESQLYSFSQQHNCFQLRSHKKGVQGFSNHPLVF